MTKKIKVSHAPSKIRCHVKYPPSMLIAQKGDELEQRWASRIVEHIPYYASMWETYIGNDGTDHALPMLGALVEAAKVRQKLWERCYTLFESMALCWSLEAKLILQPEIHNCEAYEENLHLWMAFFANLGRIRDMAKKIVSGEIINDGSLATPFLEYYAKRNIVLHGPKVPMKLVGNLLTAPELGETRGSWNDKRTRWQDMTEEEFKVLAEVVIDTIANLEPIVNEFFCRILQTLETKLGFRSVEWSAEKVMQPGGERQNSALHDRQADKGTPSPQNERGFGSGISPDAEAARRQSPNIDPT